MSDVVELHPQIDTVQETYDDAKLRDFEEIVIIGIKNNHIRISWSQVEDQYRLAGLLEQAKLDLLND